MVIEMPMSRLRVREKYLRLHGVVRSEGEFREDDDGVTLELSIDIFDHCPTAEERAEWMRVRLLEQAAVASPPPYVWASVPGDPKGPRTPHGGVPDRAVRCRARVTRPETIGIDARYTLKIDHPVEKMRVDLRSFAAEGSVVRLYGEYGETVIRVWYRKPTTEQLAEAGEHRAINETKARARRAEREEARRTAEGFAEAFRRAREAAAAPPPPPGLAALRELGLDATATADDVRAAFRQRAKATHPDKGGSGDMGRLVELRDLALAYLQQSAGVDR
jgi:hypothetical protein